MAASKTRLTKYRGKDGTAVYAAKITEIVPFTMPGAPAGSATLKFGELDKKSNLVGSWVAEHRPQVGGYFIVYDRNDGQTFCRYDSAESMESSGYVRADQ